MDARAAERCARSGGGSNTGIPMLAGRLHTWCRLLRGAPLGLAAPVQPRPLLHRRLAAAATSALRRPCAPTHSCGRASQLRFTGQAGSPRAAGWLPATITQLRTGELAPPERTAGGGGAAAAASSPEARASPPVCARRCGVRQRHTRAAAAPRRAEPPDFWRWRCACKKCASWTPPRPRSKRPCSTPPPAETARHWRPSCGGGAAAVSRWTSTRGELGGCVQAPACPCLASSHRPGTLLLPAAASAIGGRQP